MRTRVVTWFDSYTAASSATDAGNVDWARILPLIGLHAALLALPWVDVAPIDVAVCLALYGVRMFAITGFYHRYFSHKTFSTSRCHQFVWAVIGASATQRGPLWWAANHRMHHHHADTRDDPHQSQRGFLWSHLKWFLVEKHVATKLEAVKDLAKFPELVWLDRFDKVVPILLGMALIFAGELLAHVAPQLGTSGVQLFFWGYVVSTVVLLHATLMINSVAHRLGRRAYDTDDHSRNNLLLALITFGEGWHNNHHRYCGSARQGFMWWEIDITYYVLRTMSWLGLVTELRAVPEAVLEERS